MKMIKNLLFLAIILAFGMTSCKDDNTTPKVEKKQIAYVLNYGDYFGSKSEISVYDLDSNTITHNEYKSANDVDLTSNVQSISIFDDKTYFMSNNGDKIDVLGAKDLKALVNPIAGIVKPRYAVATDKNVYISCWGGDEWGSFPNSYIAKLDKSSNTISKIHIAGGPEGMLIVGNKLYSALNVKNQVAVTDLNTEKTTFITVAGLAQHIVKDYNGNVCVSLINDFSGTYSNDSLGIAVINPSSNTVTNIISFSKMTYPGIIKVSNDGKTIYTISNESYPGKGSNIYTFDLTNNTVSESALISGESFTGIDINPKNNDIFILVSPSTTENGTMKIYNKSGDLNDEIEVGLYPQQVVFYDLDK